MKTMLSSKSAQRGWGMRFIRALLGAAPLLAAPHAVAAPLEPAACETLKVEFDSLVAGGAKSDMDRGAAWAKANLTPDRLGKIERLIAVEEQLSFRCGVQSTAKAVIKELPKPEPDTTAAQGATGTVTTGKGTPSNIPPPKRKDASKASKKQATVE
jgi:hypothetical protein